MSRQRVGAWGAELDDQEFADALAGALSYRRDPEPGRVSTVVAVGWFLVDVFRVDASTTRRHWLERLEAPGTGVCIELRWPWVRDFDPTWLVRTLGRATGVRSVVFSAIGDHEPLRPWDWPVDVGFFDDTASRSLRAAVENQYWSRFVRFVDAATTAAQIDLLLLPSSLADTVARFTDAPRLPPIHTLLTLGGTARTRDAIASLYTLRAESDAVAVGALEVAPEDANGWLNHLLFALSHDRRLDDALFAASSQPPLLVATHDAFATARTSSAAQGIARRIAHARRREEAAGIASPKLLARLGLSGESPLRELTDSLVAGAEALDWHSEGETATEVAELAGTQTAASTDGRFLQARLLEGERVLNDEPLRPSAVHRLEVRVARPIDGWSSAPAPFPSDFLPPDRDGHRLTLVFTAPDVLKEPMRATLFLPATADSHACSFHFRVPDTLARLDARVTVLHGNRILQTLRVRAAVAGQSSEGPVLVLQLESVLRANLVELAGAPDFDAAFLLNDAAGTPGVTVFEGANTTYVRLDAVADLRTALRNELENVTKSPEDYKDPTGEETRLLLLTVARAGASFFGGLRELPGMKRVLAGIAGASARIQIMSIHPDDVVPIELIYDGPFPSKDAKLCPGLSGGGVCGPDCAPSREVVCALGFWGLRHVIERRLYDETVTAKLQAQGADYAIGSEAGEHRACLPPLKSVLFASAQRAATFDKTSFDATVREIDDALSAAHARLATVDGWAPWAAQIAALRPELLLLIAHTEPELGAAVLEIGVADHLAAAEIESLHVAEPPPSPPHPGPLVLLLGCRTVAQDVPFSSFIAAFRRAQASVVLGTLTTVRGRHMAPVARGAIELLLERSKGARVSVGEIVRDLRRKLLAGGQPIGLALVSFGEVDWQLGGEA